MSIVKSHASKPPIGKTRVFLLSVLAIPLGIAGYVISFLLLNLIYFLENLGFHDKLSFQVGIPGKGASLWAIALVPAIGGLLVGILAKFWPHAVRGDGIPEAMEKVLINESVISPEVLLLKPIASGITIGSGGPFGAEGPIIATGAALGSLIGQVLHTSSRERKILLAAGAAAGIAGIFGAPISAVLLAVELLLFEYSPEAIAPVAIASALAMGLRGLLSTTNPLFLMSGTYTVSSSDIIFAAISGIAFGFLGVFSSKLVYGFEHWFEKSKIHWMWWPAIGGLAVGLIALIQPRILSVGYSNIDAALAGKMGLSFFISLGVLKLVSWAIALGSGTAGGTLAPLFTIGGCFGAIFGIIANAIIPAAHISVPLAALAGMAAVFASASGAYFGSAVFVIEATHCFPGIVPTLICCAVSSIVAMRISKTTIMTEKIFERGVYFETNYSIDPLAGIKVSTLKLDEAPLIVLNGNLKLPNFEKRAKGEANYIAVVDEEGKWMGSILRSKLEGIGEDQVSESDIKGMMEQVSIGLNESLRVAASKFSKFSCLRIPVVDTDNGKAAVGTLKLLDVAKADSKARRQMTH